jgi:transcriptional regulator with PAS, ATPase and Fis domain
VIAFWEGGHASCPLGDRAQLTLGRAPEADVPIRHTSVSRMHAVVHGTNPPSIEDLGSANGTRINGVAIEPRRRVVLSPGSLVELGSVVVLVQGGGPSDISAAQRPTPGAAPESGETEMERIERIVERVAASDIGVLLLGETGVGKGVLAESIHRKSRRSGAPLLPVNCAALAESLLESELFGYERGAFTGAVAAKPGLFEAAHGGTLLLDEVGELPLSTQAKLLRVLDSGEVLRLGSRVPQMVDVRIIAATNRDLEALVRAGAFRRDLYFRLNVVAIALPPLRERRHEIEGLARRFVDEASARAGRPAAVLTARALAALLQHDWPGNVRELRNVIERAVVVAGGAVLDEQHLELRRGSLLPAAAESAPPSTGAVGAAPAPSVPAPDGGDLKGGVRDYERERIAEALERAAGNQTRAAKLLGVSRRTLVRRLADYALPRPRKPDGER